MSVEAVALLVGGVLAVLAAIAWLDGADKGKW